MHVPVPKRVFTTREALEGFGLTARCPRCLSLLKGTARQAHTENCRKLIEEELRSSVKAETAQRRVKENQQKATRGRKQTKTNIEEGQAQRERADDGPDWRRCTNNKDELEQ